MSDPNRPFSDEERAGLYRAIFERRDVRSQFLPDPIPRPVLASYNEENAKAANNYSGERQKTYLSLKLQGIVESPMNLCITCDRSRGGTHVLGRNSIVDMDLFSTCLAVQNLWLAARAEGIGVGWVSIIDQDKLARILNLPDSVYPLAYLCLGYVSEFLDQPELQTKGWRSRLPLEDLLHRNGWGQSVDDEILLNALKS